MISADNQQAHNLSKHGTQQSLATDAQEREVLRPPTLNGTLLDNYHDGPDNPARAGFLQNFRHRSLGRDSREHLIFQSQSRQATVRPELILGESNLLPFDFLRTGDRVGRAVVKIVRGDGAVGTGFMVAPGVLLTNHHVLPDAATASAATVTANYEFTPPSDPAGRVVVVPLRPAELFLTSADLDFTFCGVRGLDHLGTIPLDRNGLIVSNSEYVNIVQHPRGQPKHVALQDNLVVQADHVVVRYTCDTEAGSSGSPVFNNQWRLVALHHASVEVEPPQGRPAPGTPSSSRFLNEGIRVSAISLWLDSETMSSTDRPDQLARIRALFHGVDPRVGLFGGLARPGRSQNAAQTVVESYQLCHEILDLAYWDLTSTRNAVIERLEPLTWAIAELGLDLWCLVGCSADLARELCNSLESRLGLQYRFITLGGEKSTGSPHASITLLTRSLRGLHIEPFALSAPGTVEPVRLLLRTDGALDRVLRLVITPPGLQHPPERDKPWNLPGAAQARTKVSLKPERWMAGINDAGIQDVDTIMLGPSVPASPEGLELIARTGWIPRAAGIGPDGACVLASGPTTRIERLVVSPNIVPVWGSPTEIQAAVDRELPHWLRCLSNFEPLALRVVFGPPQSVKHSLDSALARLAPSTSRASHASWPPSLSSPTDYTFENEVLALLAPIIERLSSQPVPPRASTDSSPSGEQEG